MQGNNYGLLVKTIKKNSQNHLFGQPNGFSLLTGTKFAVRLIELPFTLQHDREFVMFRFCFPLIIKLFMMGVDKIRNMEHAGTFRNIPEHEKIKVIFMKKN